MTSSRAANSPKTQTVLFRVDASPIVGFGPQSRCLAIAEALRDVGIRSVFAQQSRYVSPHPARDGHECRALPDAGEGGFARLPLDEAERLVEIGREHRVSWILVDHYGADRDYLRRLGADARRIALMDDCDFPRGEAADLVVNPNPGASEHEYPLRREARALVGPAYAPLRKVFRLRREEALASRRGPLRRVLVVMGGADTLRLGPAVVADLAGALPPSVEVRGLVGPADGRPDELRALRSRGVSVAGPLDPDDLATEMIAAQAAVATPSTVCWEMAVLGMPMVVIRTADNQALAAHELARLGAARVLAPSDRVSDAFAGPSGLLEEGVRERLSRAAASLVDGLGADRVAATLAGGLPRLGRSGSRELPRRELS